MSSAAISTFSCCCAVSGFEDLPGQKGSHLLSYSGIHLQTYPERFLLPSKRKNRDIPWSLAVWGSVRFGSVQCVCEGRLGLQGTAEPFSSTAGTFGKTHLGTGEIPLQPLEDRGGAGTSYRQVCSEGAAVCRTHTETIAVLKDCSLWRRGPTLGQGKSEEGEATERSCCDWHQIPTSHCLCTTHRGRRLKSQEWSWACKNGEMGDSRVFNSLYFSLSKFIFVGNKIISAKLSLFCLWL